MLNTQTKKKIKTVLSNRKMYQYCQDKPAPKYLLCLKNIFTEKPTTKISEMQIVLNYIRKKSN